MANTSLVEEPTSISARSARKIALRVLAAIILVPVLALAVVALLPSSVWRSLIVHAISHRTGRAAAIGDLKLHLFSLNPEISLEELSIGNAQWAQPEDMLRVRHLDATLHLLSLFRGRLVFPQVTVDRPVMDFERLTAEQNNWDFSQQQTAAGRAKPPLALPLIQRLSLSNGSLSVIDKVRRLRFDGQVSVQEDAGDTESYAFVLRGKGVLNGKPFDLRLIGAPLINVDPDQPYHFDAHVSAGDLKLDAKGAIDHPFDFAALSVSFSLSGSDLADAYYLSGLALPNTPPYSITGDLKRDGNRYILDDLRGQLGSSDIEGRLAVDARNKRPKLTGQLASKSLEFADLAAPLGAQATVAKQPDSIGQHKNQAPHPGLLLPDAELQTDRVRGMDADVTYAAASVEASKLPLKMLRFHLYLDDGRLKLQPLSFTLPQGQFTGTVVIDAQSGVPKTDLDMKFVDVDLEEFAAKSTGADAPFQGRLLGRIRLHGTGGSVHKAAATADGEVTLVIPNGQMRASIAELTGINVSRGLELLLTKSKATTEVRCGVASFHATDGDLKATSIIIDTTHDLITGGGDLNLKTEALDLSLRGRPKEPRLLRLRTPILLRGTLSHPEVGVHAGKLAEQLGGAAALGALLTPLAAILAFVDGGLAKDANCAALISQAEQHQ